MPFDIAASLSFAIITTFTPGPNNISSAAMGINFGYRRTLPYLLGIFSGFFIIMCLMGLFSDTLSEHIPGLESILAIVGSLYIVWLAWHTLKAGYGLDGKSCKSEEGKPLGMHNGLILQILNPKVIIYALTIYSTFLRTMEISFFTLILSGASLAFLSFTSISIWTIFGTFISRFMKNSKIRLIVNVVLSLLLLWTALQISGLLTIRAY